MIFGEVVQCHPCCSDTSWNVKFGKGSCDRHRIFGHSKLRLHGRLKKPTRKERRLSRVLSALTVFESEDVLIEQSLGTLGVLEVSSPSLANDALNEPSNLTSKIEGMENLAEESVKSAEDFQVRLYAGRIARGKLRGTRILLKAYPGTLAPSGKYGDILAANEVAMHADLQPPVTKSYCDNICKLLGGLTTTTGEQWLVFRNDGTKSAAEYATLASKATFDRTVVGPSDVWDSLDPRRSIRRRYAFILRILKQAMMGMAFMHSHNRLHQSLGPTSLVLSTIEELRVMDLQVRLRDLAYCVDVSDEALYGGGTLAEIWEAGTRRQRFIRESQKVASDLWRRAREAGAWTEGERQAFGYADDIYAAGLLFAYMAFVPLCDPGSIDGPTIERLLCRTFESNVAEFREYCLEDDRWREAAEFLDSGDQHGWNLLGGMLNADWKARPNASALLQDPFLTGAVFDTGV